MTRMARRGAIKALGSAMLLAFASCAAPSQPASSPFDEPVRSALAKRLSDDNMVVDLVDTQFIRYRSDGRLEGFACRHAQGFLFYPYRSGPNGGVSVGACAKDKVLNAKYADGQAKAFKAAIAGTPLPGAPSLLPLVTRRADGVVIYLPQLILSGLGGAGGHGAALVETVLLVPNEGSRVFVAQGVKPSTGCDDTPNAIPLCRDFPALLKELAEMARASSGSARSRQ